MSPGRACGGSSPAVVLDVRVRRADAAAVEVVNLPIIRALLPYYLYYGDDFTVECPTAEEVLNGGTRPVTKPYHREPQAARPA